MSDPTPAQQLGSFLAKFDPRVAASARAALAQLRKKLPGAIELVYDNYNALAIGFGPSEKASEAIFSIAVAAAEAAVGLGLVIAYHRHAKTTDLDAMTRMKG